MENEIKNENEQPVEPAKVEPVPEPVKEVTPAPTKVESKDEVATEMEKWQQKIDEAKVQLNLGAKDAQDKLKVYVDKLEKEYAEAKVKWDELDSSADKAWADIKSGFNSSLDSMTEAYNKAKEYFNK